MKILILGGGNMGLTYAQCFLRSRIVTAENMMVLCRSWEKANHLSANHEGRFFSDPRLCVPEAAKQMGFSASEAELLVGQTFTGAIDLYNKSDLSCENWIGKVASKGGTTEAALRIFRERALYDGIQAGAEAALTRARELGK